MSPTTEAAPGALRIAAIGDLHVSETSQGRYRALFEEMSEAADVIVLCGDLTNFGKVSEAEILAEDLRGATAPVLGVLGNHDYECGCAGEVISIGVSSSLNTRSPAAIADCRMLYFSLRS